MEFYCGIPIISSEVFVKKVPARKNKKRRINKKWIKRYGYKEVPDKSVYYARGNGIVGHPETIEKLIRILKNTYGDKLR